jgi:hypothetical protein
MRVAVKTGVAVGVGGSRKEGVAGIKGVPTISRGCEVGFGAIKAGSDEGGTGDGGTILNDDQARYNSPANRET